MKTWNDITKQIAQSAEVMMSLNDLLESQVKLLRELVAQGADMPVESGQEASKAEALKVWREMADAAEAAWNAMHGRKA